MPIIETSNALADFCQRLTEESYIAIDTEFLRDKTYWPILCLVQIASSKEVTAIDPLAPEMDLDPLFAILQNRDILKVFHAGRQDIEIFVHLTGAVPTPLYDTQIAAMTLGFGDAVSYEWLAGKLAGVSIDKSLRFSDWSHRPLTKLQLEYALNDVIHLRHIYERINAMVQKSERSSWGDEEMAILNNVATYKQSPENAWLRLKFRSNSFESLNALYSLAAWRETEAQKRNLPRPHVLSDDAIVKLANHTPRHYKNFVNIRSLAALKITESLAKTLLEVINAGLSNHIISPPVLPDKIEVSSSLIELLKVLLKTKCENHSVAQRLVAVTSDLERIASEEQPPIPALTGWRYEIFGADALALKQGKLALTIKNGKIHTARLS